MARSTRFYGHWAEHNGKTVLIDGIKHRIRADVYQQRYPYPEEVISVTAEPIDKGTRYYLDTKAKLGDDWSTDILASDVELIADVERQCEEQPDTTQVAHYPERPR